MPITLQQEARRVYLLGDTYPVKDRIKDLGGHWDADRKAWWVGSGKLAEAQALAAAAPVKDAPATPEDLMKKRVYAKVKYKGRTYYVIGEAREKNRCRLTVLDGSINFWADMAACELVKTYQPRERTYNYGRSRETVYTTLGSIKSYIEDMKKVEAKGQYVPEGGYVRDGEVLMRGCGECSRLGRMCPQCEFDEYDN